jgi:tRNA(Ile)-lysidine synthase TilS/MesJ
LKKFQQFSLKPFNLKAVKINLGFDEQVGNQKIKDFCESIDVPIEFVDTKISKIIFDVREEKNPCSLCANMRRGALCNAANKLGIDKIALGHHKDDYLETFFMNLFYSGRINTFQAKSFLSRKEVFIIRPFINVDEHLIETMVKQNDIPTIESQCPVDQETTREEMKAFIEQLNNKIPNSKKSVEAALDNEEQFNLW